eukprot:4884471-Heterocapsa_arctica.AAC.1
MNVFEPCGRPSSGPAHDAYVAEAAADEAAAQHKGPPLLGGSKGAGDGKGKGPAGSIPNPNANANPSKGAWG